MRAPAALPAVGALIMGCAVAPVQPIRPAALPGWAAENHAEALAVATKRPATSRAVARTMLERFEAVPLGLGAAAPFVTGYFEPVIRASLVRDATHSVPIYRVPGEDALRSLTRAEIEAGGLSGRGLELAWLVDPVDAFFLHVQGSGRLRLPDGRDLRVGFAGRNTHPYRSIGRLLVERGEVASGTLTADLLADRLRADPVAGAALMRENPSFIFFETRAGLSPEDGPIGAAGTPLTPLRSVAVDPDHIPLGSLLWLEMDLPGAGALARLMVAEDTGSAIKGPARLDLFTGTGALAGRLAGRLSEGARLWLLRAPSPHRPGRDR